VTKKQTTLKTRDKAEAYRLVAAKNETEDAPAFSLQLARVYWKAGDPAAAKRTWQNVMDEIPKLKHGDNPSCAFRHTSQRANGRTTTQAQLLPRKRLRQCFDSQSATCPDCR
jgi:hypothetical protein